MFGPWQADYLLLALAKPVDIEVAHEGVCRSVYGTHSLHVVSAVLDTSSVSEW